jgi:hypothetical protein
MDCRRRRPPGPEVLRTGTTPQRSSRRRASARPPPPVPTRLPADTHEAVPRVSAHVGSTRPVAARRQKTTKVPSAGRPDTACSSQPCGEAMWRGRTPSLATAIGPGDRRRDRATRLRVRRTRIPPDRRRGRAPLTERSRLLPARCAAGVDGAARAPARSRPPARARCCIGRVVVARRGNGRCRIGGVPDSLPGGGRALVSEERATHRWCSVTSIPQISLRRGSNGEQSHAIPLPNGRSWRPAWPGAPARRGRTAGRSRQRAPYRLQ